MEFNHWYLSTLSGIGDSTSSLFHMSPSLSVQTLTTLDLSSDGISDEEATTVANALKMKQVRRTNGHYRLTTASLTSCRH